MKASSTGRWIVCLSSALMSSVLSAVEPASAPVRFGRESRVPPDPRQQHARSVRFRPGDGQTVRLNPPRFSWPYTPAIAFKDRSRPATMRFTLQVARTADFAEPVVNVRDTDCNFYSFLPVLSGARVWYWRVGYREGGGALTWSDVRSFEVAEDAVVWDRSRFAGLLDGLSGHPRILFTVEREEELRSLSTRHAFCGELAGSIVGRARRALASDWYKSFPRQDDKRITGNGSGYLQMGRSLVMVAFAHKLTGEVKYEGYRDRLLTMASWPAGGKSSPEGMAGNTKWNTHLTEYMGLMYDWAFHELTPDERAQVRAALEWRIDHTLNSYAWMRKKGTAVGRGSIAVSCSSHPYENTMVTIPGALAICDESPVARKALEVGLHYVVAITNGMGEDEGWNEGPGYGNGKMKWLTDATWYLQSTVPQLDLGRNEAYGAYCDFFARITPLGARHSSFGNRGRNERDWASSRVTTMRRMAMLGGNGQAMRNWVDTRRRLQDMGVKSSLPYSPWIDYALPL